MQSQIAHLTTNTSPIIYIMLQALDKAVPNVLRDFGEVERLQVHKKGPYDFVSKTNIKCEDTIIRSLQWSRPEYAILGEGCGYLKGVEPDPEDEDSYEASEENENENEKNSADKQVIDDISLDEPFNKSNTPTFVINPIDGTTNFIHGIPHFCMALTLIHKNTIKASVIYDPIRSELFWAEEGEGAWLNQHRIKTSGRISISDTILCAGIDPSVARQDPQQLKQFYSCLAKGHILSSGVRRTAASSLDLAYVAAGRFDAFWHSKAKIWDVAPGALLIKEAGGMVCNFEGNPPDFTQSTSLFASQSTLGPRLFSWLKATPLVKENTN